jgi:hypothetical protein
LIHEPISIDGLPGLPDPLDASQCTSGVPRPGDLVLDPLAGTGTTPTSPCVPAPSAQTTLANRR